MTEKRYLLKYIPYECSNGEVIEKGEPYFIDTKEKIFDIDDYYTIDGYPIMSDKQVLDLLNENEQLKKELNSFKPVVFQDTTNNETILLYAKEYGDNDD